MRQLFLKLLILIFQPECIICGKKLTTKHNSLRFCRKCLKGLMISNYDNLCPICCHPLTDNSCPSCDKLDRIYFDSLRTIGLYRENNRRIIYLLKKNNVDIINKLLFKIIIKKFDIDKETLITVVPDSEIDRYYKGNSSMSYLLNLFNKHGYKTSFLIKKEISLFNRSQKNSTQKTRLFNIKNKFGYNIIDSITNKRVLLIDDIYTTGATINYCSKILKEAGVKTVDSIVFFRSVLN